MNPKNSDARPSAEIIARLTAERDTYKRICQDHARHDFLVRLLRGGYPDIISATNHGTQCEIIFPHNNFSVLLIHVENIHTHFLDINNSSQTGLIYTTLNELIHRSFSCYCESYTIATGFNLTVLLNPSDPQIGDLTRYIDFLHRTSTELVTTAAASGISVSIVYGKPYIGLEGIKAAFTEVSEFDSYRKTMGLEDRVFFCCDYSADSLYHPPSENELPTILELIMSILQKDYRNADKALSEYMENVMSRHTPTTESYLMQYYGFDYLMFLCTDTMKRQNTDPDLSYMFRPEALFRDLSYPESARRMSRLLHLLDEASGGNSAPNWISEVYRYVQENFRDVNLNITTIANTFSMNPAYMSRAFRKYTGQSLLEFLNLLRLRDAKLMILSGTSLETAAIRSGFGSTITMKRCFKRYENHALLP